ncbi:darcynin family protein [Burkholderia paludis]|uniref:darcynin family protein n=1 Tax=Burkholderia paludis TaxID=1506587 RepID=UPI0009DCB207|nr:darcynin family protein [Burkholderia paludis]
MTRQASPPAHRFMRVDMRPEWLGLPVPERFRQLREHVEPILKTHGECVSLRFRDTRFYSACLTDLWVRDEQDHHTSERVVETLRETPFRDRYVDIAEILPDVEERTPARATTAWPRCPPTRPTRHADAVHELRPSSRSFHAAA